MKLFICNVIGPYQTGEILKKKKKKLFSANSSGQQLSERERIRKKRDTLLAIRDSLWKRKRDSIYLLYRRKRMRNKTQKAQEN